MTVKEPQVAMPGRNSAVAPISADGVSAAGGVFRHK